MKTVDRIRLKKGDAVKVLVGKDRGRTGRILRVDRKRGHVYVEGINLQKRHRRPEPQRQIPGGIIEREGPIHPSNVVKVR
ncbi:MAG TPA: 50S ribosomal protein L24 [bacterium]|nr:50S ribosomal protein L24 [bacterium]HQL61979.1 50S ribosomal protein L24 [bacterium]